MEIEFEILVGSSVIVHYLIYAASEPNAGCIKVSTLLLQCGVSWLLHGEDLFQKKKCYNVGMNLKLNIAEYSQKLNVGNF